MKLEIGSKLAFRLALREQKQIAIMHQHANAYLNRLVYRQFPDTPFCDLDPELRRGLNLRHRKPQ